MIILEELFPTVNVEKNSVRRLNLVLRQPILRFQRQHQQKQVRVAEKRVAEKRVAVEKVEGEEKQVEELAVGQQAHRWPWRQFPRFWEWLIITIP